jgi:L-iditol 2-dehydrogenase
MLAVMFKEPGTIEVERLPEPQLEPCGLVVATSHVGVCGSDVRTWRHGNARLAGPQVLGHEVTGTVVESDVEALPAGTRVAVCPGVPCMVCDQCQRARHNMCTDRRVLAYDFPGGMAERFAVPADAVRAGCAVALPDGLSLRAAALAEPLHTVLNGQEQAEIGPRDSVLVLGLGPIGTLHAAVARSRGAAPLLGLDLNPARVEAAAAALGDGVVELLDGDADRAALKARGGRRGWDVVVLANGAPQAVELALDVVAPCGRVVAFAGMPKDRAVVPIDLNRLHYQQIRLVGAFAGSPRTFRDAVAWLARTEIDLDRIVTDVLPLERATDAFARVEQGIGIKTVLEVVG